MRVRQTGQPLYMVATVAAQAPQNRECPHGTNATPSRGAIKHTYCATPVRHDAVCVNYHNGTTRRTCEQCHIQNIKPQGVCSLFRRHLVMSCNEYAAE